MFDIYDDSLTTNKMSIDEMRKEMLAVEKVVSSIEGESTFPEFLFEPMQNEFEGDNYLERGIVVDELSQSVRMLRRKYANYYKYVDAMDVYNNYIQKLIDKYGSLKFAKSGIEAGVFPEMLPAQPKLKMRKGNKALLNATVPISRFDPELEDYFEDSFRENTKLVNYNLPDNAYDMKSVPKELEAEFVAQRKRARKRNMLMRYRGSAEIDAIVDFMNSGGSIRYGCRGDKLDDENGNYSVSQILEDNDKLEYQNQDIRDIELEELQSRIENGRLYSDSKNKMLIDVMTEMYKEGWDISGRGSSLGKTGMKMLNRKIGEFGAQPLSKKERKKLKKKQKKANKLLNKQMQADERVANIMKQNKLSFSRGGAEMSFRLRDIYEDD